MIIKGFMASGFGVVHYEITRYGRFTTEEDEPD